MALLEQWRAMAYSEKANKGDLQRLWASYFQKEKEIYAQLLKNPDEVVRGTVKELAEKYDVDIMTMTGFLDGIDENGEISEDAKEKVSQLLKQSFRPEFLNRLDEIVYYKPLTKENITKIIDLLIVDLAERLKDKQLKLEITPLAKDLIIENGYDPVYGARPLKRYLQSKIETMIARTMLENDLQAGNTIEIGAKNGDFTVKIK